MCYSGSVHAGLTHGLSRMTGNCNVRFLGEGVAVMPPPYPTAEEGVGRRQLHRRLEQGGNFRPHNHALCGIMGGIMPL